MKKQKNNKILQKMTKIHTKKMKIQHKKIKNAQLLTKFAQLLTDFADKDYVRNHTKLCVCSKKHNKNKKKLNNVQQKQEKMNNPTKIGM